ncbi:possible transposase (plasmid) [Rhodococcus jostii RHA1]|uniref:Possible transposase n=1 Tax=Rhodococcus jostii (strain RHA1) TaxID=101510 RepID=Q0RVH3_RHOJR|nr:possible transposase [Rhodococcus jostii RHA1]
MAAPVAFVRSDRSYRAPPVHRMGAAGVFETLHLRCSTGSKAPANWLVGSDPGRGERPSEKGLAGPAQSIEARRDRRSTFCPIRTDPTGLDISGANTYDSTLLQPMVSAIPAVKSRLVPRRRKPAKLRADKGHDYDIHHRWLRGQGTRA